MSSLRRHLRVSVLGSVLAYLVAALSPTMDVANGALPAYVVTLLFFVGLLVRADDQPAPKWEEIEHRRDGRERLGYNPAFENRGISHEDWLSVKAHDEYVEVDTEKKLRLPVKGGDRAALARL